MAYQVKYVLPFSNELNEFYEVYFEKNDFIGKPVQLTGAIDCLKLRSTAGDEDKFYPILGTECIIRIASMDDTISIYDLIAEHDNDIRITVYKDQDYTKSIFQGFVVAEDNNQPLLDPPFVLSIRALDCLGLLKGVDLTDFNNNLFSGRLSIQNWIGNILMKTGQTLNIRFYFPITNDPRPEISGRFYADALNNIFLDAITFQKGELQTTTDPSVDLASSEADDCYTALEKIIRCFRCRLFQQDGVWNVVNIYSYMNPGGYYYYEVTPGTLTDGKYSFTTVATAGGQTYDVNVGRNQIIHPVQDDATLYLKLATKWIKLTYNYDQSLNKIFNQDFTQLGTALPAYDELISDEVIDPTLDDNTTNNLLPTFAYEVFSWSHEKGSIPFEGSNAALPDLFNVHTAATTGAFIRVVKDLNGYEEQRFAVIQRDDAGGKPYSWLRSSDVLVDTADKIYLTFDFRTRTTGSTTAFKAAALLFFGDDGSFWSLNSGNEGFIQQWVKCEAPFYNFHFMHLHEVGSTNWTQVTSADDTHPGAPIVVPGQGKINLLLLSNGIETAEHWYKNIDLTISPYLLGTYTELKGDYNFSTSTNDIKQTNSQDVEISDSPKRYFKGALVDSTGTLIKPAWHRIGFTESWRFTELMEYLIYTNVNRMMQKVEGTFRGLVYRSADLTIRQAGYLNRYSFPEHPVPTKKFMLTSFDDDYTTGFGRRVYVEVLEDQNDTGFDIPGSGNYLFQYLF